MAETEQVFVIVGGDAAGMTAAVTLRRELPKARIVVFESGEIVSYAQCGLPYYLGGVVDQAKRLIVRSPAAFRERYGLDLRTGHHVKEIDLIQKSVTVNNLATGERLVQPFDKLLLATGARPIEPGIPGMSLKGVATLKTIPDAERIKAQLKPNQDVVVIGAGFVGLELAEAFSGVGARVAVIDNAPQVARSFDPDMAAHAQEELNRHGVQVFLSEAVKEFQGSNNMVREVVTDKRSLPADLVVVAVGVVPNSELAKEAGLELSLRGAVGIDRTQRTSHPDVFAAGDCTVHYHLVKEDFEYIPLGTHANKQGVVAGLNMAGREATFGGAVGTSILKVFDLAMGRTGFSEEEARLAGRKLKVAKGTSLSHAGYYPDAEQIHVKLVFDAHTERLLGGQAAGRQGVDKAIDVLATALYYKAQIEDLEHLDLAYAPPYSSVWAPLQAAARRRPRQK